MNDLGLEALWAVLATVTDPELPVISVVDLGIVRRVELAGRRCSVEFCPTFLGCPARRLLAENMRRALEQAGFDAVVGETFADPWTPAHITSAGRDALRRQQISVARPARNDHGDASASLTIVDCPRCGAEDSELVSAFGATRCRALRRCRCCRNLFEEMRPMTARRSPLDVPASALGRQPTRGTP